MQQQHMGSLFRYFNRVVVISRWCKHRLMVVGRCLQLFRESMDLVELRWKAVIREACLDWFDGLDLGNLRTSLFLSGGGCNTPKF